MPHICFDESRFFFPSVDEADEEGLLLIGGKVTPSRVLEAYGKGIFPWFSSEDLPLWWSPDPRFVLFPDELHVSRSMKKTFSKNLFEFKINTAFEDVIQKCSSVKRKEQDGTWITEEMKQTYIRLYQDGFAHSAEAWQKNNLVGGMYGIQIGNIFFGESMFSLVADASKFAFISFIQMLKLQGVKLVDCQVYTPHVESLGGRLIDRNEFIKIVEKETAASFGKGS